VILMYHRVAEPASDPWDLAVAPDRFEAQMAHLRRRRTPLSLAEFMGRLEAGELPADAAAVTFDDGYADNLVNARPRLQRHAIPATVYLVSDALGSPRGFWWDELARLVLEGRRPLHGTLELPDGGPIALALDDAPAPPGPWRGWEPPRCAREAAFVQIWSRLRALDEAARQAALAQLRALAQAGPPPPEDLPLTLAQLREMLSDGLISAGAHTRTHAFLPELSPAGRRREIEEGKAACEALLGRPVEAFAYPHGGANAEVRAAVRQAGFRCAVTTEEAAVRPDRFDPFALPRLQALNWSVSEFDAALRAL
jgi:peptidoglycan/xylan/chitin deacetylase (PgdA/CDA1 family)